MHSIPCTLYNSRYPILQLSPYTAVSQIRRFSLQSGRCSTCYLSLSTPEPDLRRLHDTLETDGIGLEFTETTSGLLASLEEVENYHS